MSRVAHSYGQNSSWRFPASLFFAAWFDGRSFIDIRDVILQPCIGSEGTEFSSYFFHSSLKYKFDRVSLWQCLQPYIGSEGQKRIQVRLFSFSTYLTAFKKVQIKKLSVTCRTFIWQEFFLNGSMHLHFLLHDGMENLSMMSEIFSSFKWIDIFRSF